jgi:hypothetical protein
LHEYRYHSEAEGNAVSAIAEYEAALWECYKLSGADTDGDQGPAALIGGNGASGFARIVVEAVRELRLDYDSVEEPSFKDCQCSCSNCSGCLQ